MTNTFFLELSVFLEKNLITIYFIYGLSFFFIASAILFGFKTLKSIGLGKAFLYLFVFSIAHGSVEWIDMYNKYRMLLYDAGISQVLIQIRLYMLSVSFSLLFLFGLELLTGISLKPSGIKINRFFPPLAVIFIVILTAFGGLAKTSAEMDIWVRYLLGFPSAMLASIALFRLSRREYAGILPKDHAWYFKSSSYLMAVYGFTMLVVQKSGISFASYLTQTSFYQDEFFKYMGVPIQAVMALTVLLISYFIIRAMAMRIHLRLMGTFIVFFVMLVISGFTGYLNLELIVKSYKDVVKLAAEEKDFSYLNRSFDRMYNFVNNPVVAKNRELYAPLFKEYTRDFETTLGEIKSMTHEDPEEVEAIEGISMLYRQSFKEGMTDIGFASLEKLKALVSRINEMHSKESEAQKETVLKNAGDFNRVIFITLFVSFLGLGFIWHAFYKALILPLYDLRQGANHISEGDLSYRIKINTADELQEFANDFNIMGEKLLERTKKLEAANEELNELSIRDGLTRLYNHRYFYNRLKEEFERAQRYKSILSLFILDVDDFKNYNDKNGHLKGDDVLRTLAEIISKNSRNTDIACRYGGEEFAIILPETSKEGAAIVAERIRRAVQEYEFPNEKSQPLGDLTVTIGVSSYPVDSNELDYLVKMADDTLYRAKREGKNKVYLG